MFGVEVQNIRDNRISVGPRLESRCACSLQQIRWLLCYFCYSNLIVLPDSIILKLIGLFILLFCLQNAKMVTIYWFYLKLKSRSYKRYAGCGFTR